MSGDIGIFKRDTWQAGKASKSVHDVHASVLVAATQNPFGFEQNGSGDKDIASLDQRFCPDVLLWIVFRQETNEDIGINGPHDVWLPA